MKLTFPKFKKNFRKESFKVDPNIYWAGIVSVFFLIVFASFIFAYNLFKVTSGDTGIIIEGNIAKAEKEKKEEINKVLKYFYDRKDKSDNIVNMPIPVIDPSL